MYIPGYKFIPKHRINSPSRGVGLFLADSLEFKCRSDFSFPDDECAESLFVEFNRHKERNLIVGVIYRPPKQRLYGWMATLAMTNSQFFKASVSHTSQHNTLMFTMIAKCDMHF